MIVVDAHMHIWDRIDGRIGDDRVVPTENGKTLIGDAEVLMMPPGFTDSRVPAETALAYFDDAGVHVGVVVQEYMDGSQNEYLVDVMGRHPDRFFCHALLDFFNPAGCLAEYGRVQEMGFRGVKVPAGHLFAADPRVRIDDPGIMRVYAAMEADGMVLSVDLAEGEAQVAELANIARAHPGLAIVLGHFAMANRPGWMEQLRLCKLPNVYVESGGICWLFRDEGEIRLTSREWALFDALLASRGRVMSRRALEERLYSFGDEIEGNAVEVYVSRLRAKLGARLIETRRGLGYLIP